MSKIRLHGSSSGYTEIAPVAASGNNTLTLPNDGTIISQDSNGAVGVTSITVGTGVTIGDGKITCDGSALTSINAAQIVGVCTSGLTKTGGFGGGKISQVQQTVIDSQTSINSDTETEIMNVSITPSATSSKVLVCVNMAPSYTNDTSTEFKAIIYRDSTAITGLARYFGSSGVGPVDGCLNGMFLDSPNTTSAVTYRMKTTRVNGSNSYVVNHTNSEAKSTITAMEITS